jgi:transposase
MNFRIRYNREKIKVLIYALQKAYELGDIHVVKRVSAMLRLHEGQSISNTAQTLGVSPQTIYNWLKDYLLKGSDSFKFNYSPGRKPKMTKAQKLELKQCLLLSPTEYGYDTECWNTLIITDLIYRKWGILYHRGYLCQLLHNLGFSWQKARFVSDHLDPIKRQEWKQNWHNIVKQAQQMNALLLFGDEASFPQWGTLSYTWALTGCQPTVQTSGKRKAYKVFGLIDYFSGRMFFQGHTGRFNSESYQHFLLFVMKQTDRHIFLIQDNARYHTSASMKRFFLEHSSRITVHPLPSYSPDYNPIEYLWKKVKKGTTHNRYFPDFESLVDTVERVLERLTQVPEEVLALMGEYRKSFDDLQFPVAA